jgi:Tol biopolymer transport system component
VASLETGEYRVVLEGGTRPRYSPTGHLVYARAGNILAVAFDLEELEVTGAPITVLEGVITVPNWANAAFDLSPDGSLLYAPGGPRERQRRIVWVDREGHSQPLIEATRPFQGVGRLSPDGAHLTVTISGANNRAWIYDLDRGTLTLLVTAFDVTSPIWTPDGAHVTFTSTRAGAGAVFWQVPDGSAPAEQLTGSEYWRSAYSWSPDGTVLSFREAHPETRSDIWLLNMDVERTAQPLVRTEAAERNAAFSPDGHWLAYQSDESGAPEIYVRAHRGPAQKQQVSTGGARGPCGTRAGRSSSIRTVTDSWP